MNEVTRQRLMTAGSGVLAGALGVVALDAVTSWMWRREDPAARAREEAVRPLGLDPANLLAHQVERRVDPDAEPRETLGGTVIHYALGILPGAAYALLRRRGLGRGTLFGVALFVLQDVLANWALRTSAPPQAYPPQAHLRGLLGHAAYGVATDAALRALEAALADGSEARPAASPATTRPALRRPAERPVRA